MRKKIFLSVSALVVVALTAFTSYKTQSSQSTMADLMLDENIEALTAGETGKETCYNTITTKEGCKVLYCQTCTYVPGIYTNLSGKGKC